MVVGAQRGEQLLLEHGFDGATDPIAQLGLKILTDLKNGCGGCATVLHGVILRTACPAVIAALKLSRRLRHFQFPQEAGRIRDATRRRLCDLHLI
jgi:hypothetical protein